MGSEAPPINGKRPGESFIYKDTQVGIQCVATLLMINFVASHPFQAIKVGLKASIPAFLTMVS